MDDYLDKEWLSPWEAVQLTVSLDPAFGREVAELAAEKSVRESGVPGTLLGLHCDERLVRFAVELEYEDDEGKRQWQRGSRAVGAFYRAIEWIEQEWSAERIDGARVPADANGIEVKALSAHRIDFRRGSLECWPLGVQLRLKRSHQGATQSKVKTKSARRGGGGVSDWGPVIVAVVDELVEKNGPLSDDDPEQSGQGGRCRQAQTSGEIP